MKIDNKLKIKVCGMRDPVNILDIAGLSPDYMGFIYYPGSRRFAGELLPEKIDGLPENIRKTGVFVNSPLEELVPISERMGFQALQLHGDESPGFCREIKKRGYEVIKVFSIGQKGGFDRIVDYLEHCDLFLFDTAGEGYGGTGKKFEWARLNEYAQEKRFFLSGGLAPEDLEEILELDHPQLYGLDLNSGFETAPGLKDIALLAKFIEGIRNKK